MNVRAKLICLEGPLYKHVTSAIRQAYQAGLRDGLAVGERICCSVLSRAQRQSALDLIRQAEKELTAAMED